MQKVPPGSSGDNGRVFTGAGIPTHPEAPPAPGQHNEPIVPDHVSGVGQFMSRLNTLRETTAVEETSFLKNAKLNHDEIFQILGIMVEELVSQRATFNRHLREETQFRSVSVTKHLQGVAADAMERERRISDGSSDAQAQQLKDRNDRAVEEVNNAQAQDDMILQPGDDLLPEEVGEGVGEQAEAPLPKGGK